MMSAIANIPAEVAGLRPYITLAAARRIINAAFAEAKKWLAYECCCCRYCR